MNDQSPALPAKQSRYGRRGCLILAAALLVFLGCMVNSLLKVDLTHRAKRPIARAALTNLCAALRAYATEYDALPQGDQAHIMAALRGDNPHRVLFLEADDRRFNARGEYLDPWKMPYHIDVSNPEYPWAYSFGQNARDDGGAPGSDDIVSW